MIYKLWHQHAAKKKFEQLWNATQLALANKDDSISLELYSTDFELSKSKDGTRYILSFKSCENNQFKAAITLGVPVLEALARQIGDIMPSLQAATSQNQVTADWRMTSLPFKRFSDRTWRLLIEEMNSYKFISILWYLNDIDIAKAALRNMSVRQADEIAKIIAHKYEGKTPDSLSSDDWYVRDAHDDFKELLAALDRLISEGQIKEDYL